MYENCFDVEFMVERIRTKKVNMKLKIKEEFDRFAEYFCNLTNELDNLSGIDKEFGEDNLFKHYILIDNYSLKHKSISIRVPGGTVGNIIIDENGIITDIKIHINYIVKTYPDDIEKQIKKLFISESIEF